MFHAVEHYGASVTGVNTTTEQVDVGARRDPPPRPGGQDRSARADFREVHRQFDKVVSIGVLEHAGRDQLREVVKAHADFLKPGGLGMLHFIGHVGVRDTEFFIRKHVFPGGWIPSLAETIVAMEECGLEVVDIENLRRHYALDAGRLGRALRPQLGRASARSIRKASTSASGASGAPICYACAEMFRSPNGRTHLFQIVFSKGNITERQLPDEPRLSLRRTERDLRRTSKIRRARRAAAGRARRSGERRSGLAKDTSNLFRDRDSAPRSGGSTCAPSATCSR